MNNLMHQVSLKVDYHTIFIWGLVYLRFGGIIICNYILAIRGESVFNF
jgi:hypothetical protein